MSPDTTSALIGGLLVVLAMVACYIVIITADDPLVATQCAATPKDGFTTNIPYSPSCGDQWLRGRRAGCTGHTRGSMPSIDAPPAARDSCFPAHMRGSEPGRACCSAPACGGACI